MAEININELELYFETFGFANEDLEISQGIYVLCEDSELFVTSIIQALKSHKGNQNYRTYYEKLVMYYKLCYELNK